MRAYTKCPSIVVSRFVTSTVGSVLIAHFTLQVIVVGSDLQETLQQASVKFGEEIVKLRSPNGGLIDDISLLR